MLEDDVGDRPGKLSLFENAVSRIDVGFDQQIFRVIQSVRLAQDLGGDAQLADVVDGTGNANDVRNILREPHLIGNCASQLRHASLMAGSVGIACFRCLCQDLDRALESGS